MRLWLLQPPFLTLMLTLLTMRKWQSTMVLRISIHVTL